MGKDVIAHKIVQSFLVGIFFHCKTHKLKKKEKKKRNIIYYFLSITKFKL